MEKVLSAAGKVNALEIYDMVLRKDEAGVCESPLYRYEGWPYEKALFGIRGVEVLGWTTRLRKIPGDRFFRGLRSLDLSGSIHLEDVSFLQEAEGLEFLRLNDCISLRDIGGVEDLGKLRGVSLEGCREVRTLLPLIRSRSLGRLEYLYLPPTVDDYELGRICMFGRRLRHVRIVGAEHVTSLEPVGRLKELERLTVIGCGGIRSLAGLEGLKKLRFVDLGDMAGLEDVSALAGKELERYVMQGCPKVNDKK